MEFVEASKPIFNNVESSVGLILPDQIEKSSMDSKFVEAPNPDGDYAEFSEGIIIQAITKDLMPGTLLSFVCFLLLLLSNYFYCIPSHNCYKFYYKEKDVETEIRRETSDVQQPLQVDVSDLFLEWAKYCSKEKAPEYKTLMQGKTCLTLFLDFAFFCS